MSRFYAISQIEYCRNFIFNRHFPIHKLFECCCEVGLWRLTADKLAEIFGTRVHRRMQGELATVIDCIDTTFAVRWKGRYRIEGAACVYSDNDTAG